ncbi:MAG TPA: ATP-binding protein [Roseiarcus sp.]|nr:ATP-binding protein [Roseiarcus sp.]
MNALRAQSIASRLFISAAFWSFTILLIAGVGLSAINRRSTEASFDERLGVYLKALVVNVANSSDESRAGSAQLIDPEFNLARSGWYWQITRLDAGKSNTGQPEIRTSPSLAASLLPRLETNIPPAEEGAPHAGYVKGPDDRRLRLVERVIDAGDEGRYLIQVAANAEEIESDIENFEYALGATFLLLAIALIGSMALAVRFGLSPLRALQEGVVAIRRGEAEQIKGDFPQDIAPLAAEVNLLLEANREVVERARTQVGNLAHALKTPLSILINEAEAGSPMLAEKAKEQAEIMRHQVAFYLDRARAAARANALGSATEVKPVIEGLTRTFQKVYRDRALAFSIDAPDGLRFRGEEQDLTDLIGNLLDNAGKWAHERIDIHAARDPRSDSSGRPYFITMIDDDGPGLDPQARAEALRRGKRLDESRPGSGLGLSIIVDLAHLYGGALQLEDSPLGGLRATLRLPAS